MLVVGAVVIACGGSSASTRPQQSLSTFSFSPLPTLAIYSPIVVPPTPQSSTLARSWPVGWDTAFCNAFADFTVANQLVDDIERALADKSPSDAQGLANELAQSAPVASNEMTALKEWTPADQVKADLIAMLDLDKQAAASYQSYFKNNDKNALKQARQTRTQVSKAIGSANTHLSQLVALGLTCPGQTLTIETF
jgi:hypothetical protein